MKSLRLLLYACPALSGRIPGVQPARFCNLLPACDSSPPRRGSAGDADRLGRLCYTESRRLGSRPRTASFRTGLPPIPSCGAPRAEGALKRDQSRLHKRQRAWRRSEGSLLPWPWRSRSLYSSEDPHRRLEVLQRIWDGSRNYGALNDALSIIATSGIVAAWAVRGARAAFRAPDAVSKWRRQYAQDLLEIVRIDEFEGARDLGLSRAEAAACTCDRLRHTDAACQSPAALLRRISRVIENERQAFGRYYLCAGTAQWENAKFRIRPRRSPDQNAESLVVTWKWLQRASVRGNEQARDSVESNRAYAERCAVKGDAISIKALHLFDASRL